MKDGSVDIQTADLLPIIQSIINRMEGQHFVILGVTFLLLFFGSKVIISHINSKKDTKKDDKLFEIINMLGKKIPDIQYLQEESGMLRDKIIKNSKNFEEGIKCNREFIAHDDICKIAKQTRERGIPARLDGEYYVIGADWEEEYTRFEIEVINVPTLTTGATFYAYLYNDMLKIDDVTFKTHKENKVYQMQINGIMIKNSITDATICCIAEKK